MSRYRAAPVGKIADYSPMGYVLAQGLEGIASDGRVVPVLNHEGQKPPPSSVFDDMNREWPLANAGTVTNRFGAADPLAYDTVERDEVNVLKGKLTSGVSKKQAAKDVFGRHNGGRARIP